jgi:hypothetical protein
MPISSGSTGDRETEERPRLLVSWTQVAAAAAASVTAATIASVFGVAGTLIGTVVVSVVATAGSAIYNASLRRTQIRLRQTRNRLVRHMPPDQVNALNEPVGAPTEQLPPQPPQPQPRSPWQRRTPLAVAVVAVFVAAMAVVTPVELIGRRPLAALVGPSHARSGTSIFGPGSSGSARPTPTSTTSTSTIRHGVAPTSTTIPKTSTSPTRAATTAVTTVTIIVPNTTTSVP